MTACGLPVAVQVKLTSSPDVTVVFVGGSVIIGRTVEIHNKTLSIRRYEGKPSCAITKSTLFAVSKDKWDTKGDTGKSMNNALYVLQYAKRHLSGRSNVEQ